MSLPLFLPLLSSAGLCSNVLWGNLLYCCCYITVDFATTASHNGVCKTQQMLHIMILLFQDCAMIKMKIWIYLMFFCHFLYNVSFLFLWKKDFKYNIRSVIQPLQNPPLCGSTTLLYSVNSFSYLLYSTLLLIHSVEFEPHASLYCRSIKVNYKFLKNLTQFFCSCLVRG
jgi:hypothetical protein